MSFSTRYAAGYNGAAVCFLGPDEVVWVCGNAVVLHVLSTKAQVGGAIVPACLLASWMANEIAVRGGGASNVVCVPNRMPGHACVLVQARTPSLIFSLPVLQRIIKGAGLGISCFAVNKKQRLIAVAEKVCAPASVHALPSRHFRCCTYRIAAPFSVPTPRPRPCLLLNPQGLHPNVSIYSVAAGSSLQPVQVVSPSRHGVQLGVTALAFSADGERLAVCGDEPDNSLLLFSWRQVWGRGWGVAAAGATWERAQRAHTSHATKWPTSPTHGR